MRRCVLGVVAVWGLVGCTTAQVVSWAGSVDPVPAVSRYYSVEEMWVTEDRDAVVVEILSGEVWVESEPPGAWPLEGFVRFEFDAAGVERAIDLAKGQIEGEFTAAEAFGERPAVGGLEWYDLTTERALASSVELIARPPDGAVAVPLGGDGVSLILRGPAGLRRRDAPGWYAAVPLTVVWDVVTAPIQGVFWAVYLTNLQDCPLYPD